MAIIPHLQVRNLEESIGFYRDVLGFHLEWQDNDGQDLASAMMSRGDKSISFSNQCHSQDSEFVSEFSGELMMFEEEVDFMFDEIETSAKSSKANFSIIAPLTESHGLRRFTMLDCNGYRITFAMVLNDVIDVTDTADSGVKRRPKSQQFNVVR